jgi:diaminopimelate epimerase
MRPLFFTKMEGSGNDFMIIDNRQKLIEGYLNGRELNSLVKEIADRKFGAGSDGVIILEPSGEFPFHMRYFNRDGSEASLCLNGARCVVSYCYRLGLIKEKGKFSSDSGPIGFYYRGDAVSIEVPLPVDLKLNFGLTVKRKKISGHYLKLGVPHYVIFVDSYDKVEIKALGGLIRSHKAFKPEGVNVNFVRADDGKVFVRTYERGVEDETLSCGSGALASAYIATKLFITQSPVACQTRGGDLVATIKEKLYLEGQVNYIYDGVYYLKQAVAQ